MMSTTPTTRPTVKPTMMPTTPTTRPTVKPSVKPTAKPTASPTSPTPKPSSRPTNPTANPTVSPSAPTPSPTAIPTFIPTAFPTAPTLYPTPGNFVKPTAKPTASPTSPTPKPSSRPTNPTANPTVSPSAPTPSPTAIPTFIPTAFPTVPTLYPTPGNTTAAPSAKPTFVGGKKSLAIAAILAIIISIFFVSCCCCCIYYRCKKSKRADKKSRTSYVGVDMEYGDTVANPMQNVPVQDTFKPPPPVPYVKEGLLWKQSSNQLGDWKQRKFFIKNKCLYYLTFEYALNGEKKSKQIYVCDLKLSSVKELHFDKRKEKVGFEYGFQIFTPTQNFYNFGVELQNEALDWITVIRKEIESAIVSSKEPFAGPQASKSRSSAIDPQKIQPDARTLDILYYYSPACAECGAKQPVWASLNLCVLLCPECSGVHRSLGSHISKVRGLTLDNWSINSLLLLEKIGSLKANEFWEYNMFEMVSGCLTPSSSREERYDMINLKYVQRKFIRTISQQDANKSLYEGARAGELEAVYGALVHGADVNYIDSFTGKRALEEASDKKYELVVELLRYWETTDSVKSSSSESLAKFKPTANTTGDSYEPFQSPSQMTSDYTMMDYTPRGLQPIKPVSSAGNFNSTLELLEFADDISNGINSGNPLSPI